MPFVRRLIFKGENKCETAQQHSNWSVFSDQYFHPPTVDGEGKKEDKEQIHHYYLSCVQNQKWDCPWHDGRQANLDWVHSYLFFFLFKAWRKEARLIPPAIDKTCCIDRTFMQSYLNYLLERPHTDEQMQSLANNTSVMLTEPHHWYHCLPLLVSLCI